MINEPPHRNETICDFSLRNPSNAIHGHAPVRLNDSIVNFHKKKLLKVGTFRGYFSADDARPGDVSFAASGRKDGRKRIGLNWQRLTGSVRIHLIYLQRMGRSGFGRNLRIDLRSKRRNRWHVRMIWRIRLVECEKSTASEQTGHM